MFYYIYMKYSRGIITREDIENAISNTSSMIAAARYLGVSRDRFNKYAKQYGLFNPNPSGKGVKGERKYTNEEVFTRNTNKVSHTVLVLRLKELREWKCDCCGISEWMGKPISLEIHHIDGDTLNNSLDNLQILCPNCHSQTDNWRSRNQRGYSKTSKKISDEQLIEAVNKCGSINEALSSLGLAGGANYQRVYKLLEQLKHSNNK